MDNFSGHDIKCTNETGQITVFFPPKKLTSLHQPLDQVVSFDQFHIYIFYKLYFLFQGIIAAVKTLVRNPLLKGCVFFALLRTVNPKSKNLISFSKFFLQVDPKDLQKRNSLSIDGDGENQNLKR